jgi:cytoskeletal protein RodZ
VCPQYNGGNNGPGKLLVFSRIGGNMENKTKKQLIIIFSVILLLGVISLFFSLQSNAIKINPKMENNSSGSSNASKVNPTQNTTSLTKNTISIPLEKPPFIKD